MSEVKNNIVAEEILNNVDINTGVWNLVEKSDPQELKKVTIGRKFIAIDVYPQIEKATKIFGPMGIGFGLTELNYQLTNDVDISTKKKPNTKGMSMILSSLFWYKYPSTDNMGQIPIIVDMVYNARNEIPKKLVTSSISKALSYLGFNYDVFRGSWDDNPYADRPDIPAPSHMIENLKILLKKGVELEVCTKKQAKTVYQFQVSAGWTLQSVENSYKAIIDLYHKATVELPTLLEEGSKDNGILENKTKMETGDEKEEETNNKS